MRVHIGGREQCQHYGDIHVVLEAETGVVQSRAKECQQPLEAGREGAPGWLSQLSDQLQLGS